MLPEIKGPTHAGHLRAQKPISISVRRRMGPTPAGNVRHRSAGGYSTPTDKPFAPVISSFMFPTHKDCPHMMERLICAEIQPSMTAISFSLRYNSRPYALTTNSISIY